MIKHKSSITISLSLDNLNSFFIPFFSLELSNPALTIFKLLDVELKDKYSYRNKAMLELMYATGLRVSELVNLKVVDIGVNTDIKIPGAIDRKIRKGTYNIVKRQAMSYDECIRAINIGIEMARSAYEDGYNILGVGEMGIGNTTTSSSVLVSLTECSIEEAVGKGAGITKEAFEKKKWVVSEAIKVNNPDKKDPIDVVSKVGGFDIAGMMGVFLGAAYYKIPIVIDGFISVVAALAAVRINPLVKEYLITSHCSKEIGYNIAMKELELQPMLNLDMRLGEGSGCPIAFSVIEFSCAMMNNMATFDEAEINDDYLDEVRGEENYIV